MTRAAKRRTVVRIAFYAPMIAFAVYMFGVILYS